MKKLSSPKEEYYFQWGESQSGVISGVSVHYGKLSELIRSSNWGALLISENRVTSTYVTRSFEKIAGEYSECYLQPGFRKEFLAKSAAARAQAHELWENVRSTDLSSASGDELAEFLKRFHERIFEITFYFYLSQAEFTETVRRELEKQLGKYFPPGQVPSAMAGLLAISELDILKRGELDLIALALNGWDAKKLEAHSLEYAILFYNSYSKKTNFSFLETRLTQLKGLGEPELKLRRRKILQEVEVAKRKQSQLLERIGDARTRELALLLHDVGYDRLELKNIWAGAEYRFLPLFQEISRRTEIPFNELMWVYRPEDMEKALMEGRPLSRDEIRKRKQIYVHYYHDDGHEFYSGEEAKNLVEELVPAHFRKTSASEVRGVAVSPGVVRGIARVVKVIGIEELSKDLKQFKKGEVLITTMTQPNMVLLAEKASAIVCNEGGITSHAAVLSREFKIPCVVGCEIATKAFETGDLIEVDANKGVVRKISRA